MPSSPLYAHRLADGISVLAQMEDAWIDRRTLGEILGVSKWTAWRILKQCGATEGPGGSLVCRREDLIERMQAILEGHAAPEIARRERVVRQLDELFELATRNRKIIARGPAANAMLNSRFSNLPAGVDLQPGELRIAFYGTEDFLTKLGALVYAVQRDYKQISEFIENGTRGL
jgi:hypothetical protein